MAVVESQCAGNEPLVVRARGVVAKRLACEISLLVQAETEALAYQEVFWSMVAM
jgi:hypothetical protein